MSNESRRCKRCIFWDRMDDAPEFGDCRRHAPTLIFSHVVGPTNPDAGSIAIWPSTHMSAWCGDYISVKE